MSKLPTVAIIGRPNTGKSTLFNKFVGQRKAIVSPIPGTTRDHISHRIDGDEVSYLLLDTGGIGSSRDKDFEKDVAGQSLLALEHADLIVFTINSQEEVTADDRKVLQYLRRKRKRHVPVIVVLTKADDPGTMDDAILNFQEVNIGDHLLALSAEHRLRLDELQETIAFELKKMHFGKGLSSEPSGLSNGSERDEEFDTAEKETLTAQSSQLKAPRIAIIGRPNVGKSSIVNALMSESQHDRSPLLVSPIAGTTRDSTDTAVTYHGRPYVLIDTAGLKKHPRDLDELERYAMIRTITSVDQADVVVLVLDALEPISHQDKRIAGIAIESGKGLIVLLNKIDGLKGEKRKAKINEVGVLMHFCKFAKLIPCSAVTKEGLTKLFDIVEAVQVSRTRRVAMRELRQWFERVVYGQPLGEVGRVKHITQASDVPPTFVLFVKNPKRVSVTQLRYLENRLRETFGFDGTPIRWITKQAERKDEGWTVK